MKRQHRFLVTNITQKLLPAQRKSMDEPRYLSSKKRALPSLNYYLLSSVCVSLYLSFSPRSLSRIVSVSIPLVSPSHSPISLPPPLSSCLSLAFSSSLSPALTLCLYVAHALVLSPSVPLSLSPSVFVCISLTLFHCLFLYICLTYSLSPPPLLVVSVPHRRPQTPSRLSRVRFASVLLQRPSRRQTPLSKSRRLTTPARQRPKLQRRRTMPPVLRARIALQMLRLPQQSRKQTRRT